MTTPFLLLAIAINAVFVVGYPEQPFAAHALARSMAINAVLFIAPGLPLLALGIRAGRIKGFYWLWLVFLSVLVFGAVLVLRYVLALPPSASATWIWMWIATDIGFASAFAVGASLQSAWPDRRRAVVFGVTLLLAYLAFFFSATRVVPVVGDQDDEIQGTSYGLITRLTPSLLTSRNTEYLFAHPPLINIYVAGSILYYGELDYFTLYDSQHPNRLDLRGLNLAYRQDPHLLETRTPNVFLGALTAALLADWVLLTAGSGLFALLVGAAYVTLPDVFVRSSYGGYFTVSTFFMLQMLFAAEAWLTEAALVRAAGLLAGALAAIADHKSMVLPGAVFLWTVARTWPATGVSAIVRGVRHPVVLGFLLGTALFWTYGLLISPHDFWMDHVRHHLADRVLNYNARGLDMSKYLGLGALWQEYWRHTSYLLLPGGVLALAVLCARPASDRQLDAAGGWTGPAGLWLLLAIALATAFSIIDWRQSKHLAPLVLPLILALARLGHSSPARRLVTLLLVAVVAINLYAVVQLTRDFTSLPAMPEW
jgi:hypothetical protein